MLDTVRWERVCELVEQGLDLPHEDRLHLLQEAESDPEIRNEAASLLSALRKAGETFLAGDVVSEGLVGDPAVSWTDREVGPYRVLRELGHGGMGVVLLAARADDLYEREVAIKVVRSDLTGELFLSRFRTEIRILAGFDHPAIARLLDAGITDDGALYLVMEYVHGVSIDRFCREMEPPLATILKLVMEIADAVSYAHRLSVVHRDIKPGNILVTASGEPKLLDFGIAKLASEGMEDGGSTELRAWTPAYASPEQLAGEAATAQSDVYSLGVLLYLLLTGELPYCCEGLTPEELLRSFKTTVPMAPSRFDVLHRSAQAGRSRWPGFRAGLLLSAVDPVVLKALRISPVDRYASAAEFADDLRHANAGKPTVAQMPSAVERGVRWVRRRTWTLAAGAATSAVLCAVAFGLFSLYRNLHRAGITAVEVRPSIAVLPLHNLSKAKEDDWVSAAASEIVSTELATGDRVRVARSEDVFHAEQDLHLTDRADFLAPSLVSLARNVDARYLLSGVYMTEGTGQDAHLRFDVALFDANERQNLLKRSFIGGERQLSSVAGQIAQSMLKSIGVPTEGVLAESERTLPKNPMALRWYAEGLRDLQAMNFVGARTEMEKAEALEGSSAMIHAALAEIWDGLGYDKRAQAEASRAVQMSAGLPKRAKLMIEGESLESQRNWARASEVFGTLHEFFPDDIEYALHLAKDQAATHQVDRALATLAAMDKLPAPSHGDPRIALQEAVIAGDASRVRQASEAADRALALARARGATHVVAQTMVAQAEALHHAGKDVEATTVAQGALALFQQAGDRRAQGLALNAIGNYRENLGQADGAKAAFDEARLRFIEVGDVRGLAAALNNLGNVALDRDRNEEALSLYEQSLTYNRQIDDANRIAGSLNNIAITEKSLHHLERARALYLESYKISSSIGNRGAMAMAQGNLAIILRNEGRLAEAKQSDEEALDIDRRFGLNASMAWPLQGLAHTALVSGDLLRAQDFYHQAIELTRKQGYQKQLGYALCNGAEVEGLLGDRSAQLAALDEGIRVRQALGETADTAECRIVRMREEVHEGRTAGLREQVEQMIAGLTKSNPAIIAKAHILLAEIATAEVRASAAREEIGAARRLLASTKSDVETVWEADTAEAKLPAKPDNRSAKAMTARLFADKREAARLHNRPWLLRLQLAIAEEELAHLRPGGRADLLLVIAEAHALHANGLEQMARMDLSRSHAGLRTAQAASAARGPVSERDAQSI